MYWWVLGCHLLLLNIRTLSRPTPQAPVLGRFWPLFCIASTATRASSIAPSSSSPPGSTALPPVGAPSSGQRATPGGSLHLSQRGGRRPVLAANGGSSKLIPWTPFASSTFKAFTSCHRQSSNLLAGPLHHGWSVAPFSLMTVNAPPRLAPNVIFSLHACSNGAGPATVSAVAIHFHATPKVTHG